MSAVESTNTAASIFAALGDTTRLQLVTRLGDGQPKSIAQLTRGLSLTRQAVTKHLRVLQHAGMVTRERIGRETRFTIKPDPIVQARHYLDRASAQWDDNIARLRASLESNE